MHHQFSGREIRATEFPQERRRGYQTAAVDEFLEAVAAHVDRLQAEIDGHQRTERSAMLLLQQAQQTADSTVEQAVAESESVQAAAEARAREIVEATRAEARQRMDGAEAQIEAAFADASARLNEIEREIQGRRRELALLEAGCARFAADQASRLREQADALLAAAESITSAGGADVVDALVVETGVGSRRLVGAEDTVDVRVRADDLVAEERVSG